MTSRSQDPFELSLESRQVTGLVVGTLVTLAVVFALGVGFGKRLAGAPATVAAPTDLAHLDSKPVAPEIKDTGFSFQESLLKGDPNAAVVAAKPVPSHLEAPEKKAETVVVAKPEAAPTPVVPTPVAKVEPLPPPPVPAVVEAPAAKPAPKVEPAKDAAFCVQFGASPALAEADKLASSLSAAGFSAYVVEADIPGKGLFHRVRVGRFASKDEAETLRTKARAKGFAGLVMPAK